MTNQTMLFQKAFEAAHAAGMKAGQGNKPAVMVVTEAHFDDTPVAGGKQWVVPDGVCGFAWVSFPGNTAFGRWAKKTGKASRAYGGGLQVWVHNFNQSYEKKMAYADAFTQEMAKHGIAVTPDGRLD